MDLTVSPKQLRRLREFAKLKTSDAATLARISKRAWESYEVPIDKPSSRAIPAATLELFCLKAKIPFPPVRDDGVLAIDVAKVLGFTCMKGGVGKSPITIEAANDLARRGYSVGIISDDGVFEAYKDCGEYPSYDNPTFYADNDVLFGQSELRDLENNLLKNGINPQRIFDDHDKKIDAVFIINEPLINKYRHKLEALYQYADLLKKHDYIFLDLWRDFERLISHCDLIITLINIRSACETATGEATAEEMRTINGGKLPEKLFGLCIGKSAYHHRHENTEVFVEGQEAPDSTDTHAENIPNYCFYSSDIPSDNTGLVRSTCLGDAIQNERLEGYRFISRNHAVAYESGIPMLNTSLTSAYSAEIELLIRERESRGVPWIDAQFSYFDSIVRLSPNSMPSLEIRVLVDELRTRLKELDEGR